MVKSFLDTNVFFYAIDNKDREKQAKARKLIMELTGSGDGVVSSQVVHELVSSGIRKLGLSLRQATQACEKFSDFTIVKSDLDLVLAALDLMSTTSASFWDACIVVAAQKAGCKRLYTEDLNHGQRIAGIQVVNPFL